jgi:hypothetical protein
MFKIICVAAITLFVLYLPVLLKNQTTNVLKADHTFAPIIIPSAISNVIIPLLNAVSVIMLAHVLVWSTIVTIVHNNTLLNNPILASSSEKTPAKASTDSFIYANHKNNNPNPNKNLEIFTNFLLFHHAIIKIPHNAIIGKVIASILNLNHNNATIQGVIVVPIFAPNTIPIPC